MKLSLVLSMLTVLALQAVRARPRGSGSDAAARLLQQHHHHHHQQQHATTASAATTASPCQPRDATRRRCGKELAEALRDICRFRGGYNEPNSIAHHPSTAPGGVATDCCANNRGCSMVELQQFCRYPGTAPDCQESSEEKKSDTNESSPMESAHQRNLIRPDSEQNETTDRPTPRMPSVVGGRPGGSIKQLSRTQYNNMVSVGTISSHGRIPVPIPESRRTHSSSNAVRL